MGLDVRPCGPGLSGAAAPLDAWDDAPLLRLAAPVLCVAWEAAMFARVVFAGADPSLSAPSSQAALFVLMAVGCAALFLRYRLPVVSVLFESVVGLLASVMGALAYVYFLPLVALYACVARAPRREAAAGGVAAVAAVALSAVVDGFAGASASPSPSLAMSLAGIGYPLMLVLGAALLSRFRLQRLREAEAAARAEAERDRALAKSRIAAELHDSVGHDLTAIVALSEGLAGATGDEQLDRAIASINELARSGLADTRRAVRALAGEARSTAAPSALPGSAPTEKPAERHRWDEIAALLGSVRAAGVTAALTETGVRPDDPSQAGLAFRVCREGVTNALRHAAGLSRLTVSVDHGGDGSADVAIRDDGTPGEGAGGPGTGMGLSRLRREVGESGGTLSAGPVGEGGWCLKAHLPSLVGAGEGEGESSPLMQYRRLVLPAPDGPTIAVSPPVAASEQPLRTGTRSSPVSAQRLTPSALTSAAAMRGTSLRAGAPRPPTRPFDATHGTTARAPRRRAPVGCHLQMAVSVSVLVPPHQRGWGIQLQVEVISCVEEGAGK